MTDKQKAIVDHVLMFIRGPDATARTRYETLMTSVGACLLKQQQVLANRSQLIPSLPGAKLKYVAIAMTGIASLHLTSGRTIHYILKRGTGVMSYMHLHCYANKESIQS